MTDDYDLAKTMTTKFSLSEIRTLCFMLGVEFDDLPDTKGTLTGSVIALIKLMQRQDRLEIMLSKCTDLRPNVNWELYYSANTTSSSQITSIDIVKRNALVKRQQELTEEYEACYVQLGLALSEVEKVRLKRSLSYLETEMKQIEADLAQLN